MLSWHFMPQERNEYKNEKGIQNIMYFNNAIINSF